MYLGLVGYSCKLNVQYLFHHQLIYRAVNKQMQSTKLVVLLHRRITWPGAN